MKPYGNQHTQWGEGRFPINASRYGKVASKHRRESRRLANKSRRAKDKTALRREVP